MSGIGTATATTSATTAATATATRPRATVSALTRAVDGDDVLALDQWGFGYPDPEPGAGEPILDLLDWDRVFGAHVETPARRLAGIYAAHSVECPLPGGTSSPAAGLTWVGVHPRDRRRGVLTAMIEHHLDDVATRRGEPFSLLFAAEPAIYGRFGYGLGSRSASLTVPRKAALRDVPGSDDLVVDIEHADLGRHAAAVADCYAAAAGDRPGCITRTKTADAFFDPPYRREGAESLRLMTAVDPAAGSAEQPAAEVRGYALFRRRMRWEHGVPDGTVEVVELMARDAAAARALWGRLLDLDLTSRAISPALAVDDPLLHLLVDPRAAAPRLSDGLWVRLVDVPAALAARRYATAVDVVLDVHDTLRPQNAGRWQVIGDARSAACVRTDRAPALSLDVRELGSAYLGGITLSALTASGLVTVHDDAALRTAATAFASPVAPWCAWTF
jgi:predicted acetyltransferase